MLSMGHRARSHHSQNLFLKLKKSQAHFLNLTKFFVPVFNKKSIDSS